jgi:uncharacterized coiled-coil protein SlyX
MQQRSTLAKHLGGLIIVALCAGGTPAAVADTQDDRIKALEQSLARSTAVIEALAARVAELERAAARTAAPLQAGSQSAQSAQSAQAGASAPAASRDDQARAIEALQQDVNHIVDSMSKNPDETGAAVHGFIDVGAGWSSAQDPRRERGFNAGSLDIYLTPQIGDRVKSLIELVVESGTEGVEVDLERIQLGYTLSDAMTIWAGRFHSPFGQWNTDFHHGANLQTSISRPDVIEFEDRGGLVPAHSVGLWLTGKSRLDVGRLSYDAYVANGPSIRNRQLDPGVLTDTNADKMLGFRLGYEASQGLGGLTFGMHAFTSDVDQYSLDNALRNTTQLRVLGGYVVFDAQDWELRAEYYGFSNRDVTGGQARRSNAGFVQLGRSLGAWTPYARYESAALDPLDNYFRSLASARPYRYVAAGVRYALDASSSLKLEVRSAHDAAYSQLDDNGSPVTIDAASYRRAQFQYSIAF